MRIDQRDAGASVAVNPSNSLYMCVDRWYGYAYPSGTTGAFTLQQKSDTPPANFSNYLRATVTTARTLTSTDYFAFEQRIEGYNIADLACGTSNAKSFTVSFWVRSNLTGQYSVSSYNASAGLPIAYTINQANTWEYKTLVFPANTTSTFAAGSTTNGQGMVLVWAIGMPSSYSGASGTLGSGYWAATGNVNLMATVGNTIDITGVQLEVGTAATAFERLPYTTQLQQCQRYYFNINGGGSDGYPVIGVGGATSTTNSRNFIQYPVVMRSKPTVSALGSSTFNIQAFDTTGSGATIASVSQGAINGSYINFSTSGITAYRPTVAQLENTTSYTVGIQFSAEL
jgi:hypothetical protein